MTVIAEAMAVKRRVLEAGGSKADADRAMADALRLALVPKGARAAESHVPDCGVCGDSGLISVQPETGGSFAARCLCRQGQRKSPAIASMGSVYDAASLARMFPAGLPAAVDPLPGLMTAAGVPARGIVWTFDSYRAHFSQTPMAVRYAEYGPLWAKKPLAQRSDLVLYGTHGVGKSGFTVALARQLLAQGERVKWWYVPELLLAWQATFSGKGDTHAFFEELVGYDVLMLDELMGQKATEFVESTLTTIVNARQRAERPTILTLNVTAASADAERRELTTLLGTALMDRLAEHAELWPFRGASQRPVYKRR